MTASLPALFLLAVTAFAADYDVLIRNARVIDGSGNPWFRADVGVRDGRIAAIGKLSKATAYKTVDAANRVLAPGFIDVHTHVEEFVEKIPGGDNLVLDGVTTIVTGNCGGSKANLADFFGRLEKLGIGLNVASLVGHNTVRREIMGRENRFASPEEIAKMQAMVEKGMLDGAVGFSTGLIYAPGTYSNTEEVVALAKVAAKHGGIYASHMRDEGEHVLEAITEAVTVGKEAGIPVELSHFKIDSRTVWGASEKALALVEKFRSEGVDVVVDQYPYDRSSTSLSTLLPTWALADGQTKVKERMDDAATLAKIKAAMKDLLKHKGQPDYSYATVARFNPEPAYDGKTISEITAMKGREKTVDNEIETVLEMIVAGGAQMIYHKMGPEDIERILRHPNTAIASDGGIREFGVGVPHPRSYGTNARVLAEYVRNRKVITLEDGIRRMTSLPARTFNFRDRGLIREGMAADVVLFDPAKVQDKATYVQPHQFSEGFDMVLVNGVPVVESGKVTGLKPGKVLRGR